MPTGTLENMSPYSEPHIHVFTCLSHTASDLDEALLTVKLSHQGGTLT